MPKECEQTIFLLNNFSGGIFDLLPISNEKKVHEIISTEHNFSFEFIAKMGNYEYIKVETCKDFLYSIKESQKHPYCLVEVQINPEDNKRIYEKLKTIRL